METTWRIKFEVSNCFLHTEEPVWRSSEIFQPNNKVQSSLLNCRQKKNKNVLHPLAVSSVNPESGFWLFSCATELHCVSITIKDTSLSHTTPLSDISLNYEKDDRSIFTFFSIKKLFLFNKEILQWHFSE